MKHLSKALAALFALTLLSFPAAAWNRDHPTTFGTLPSGATPPEGITTAPNGDVYVSTFGFPETGASSSPGQIVVFDRHGKLLRQMTVVGASPHLIGLAFHPMTNDLLVIDFGAGKVLRVNPMTGAIINVFTTVAGSGLNALTFDALGNVYISDSFQGIIWKVAPGGGTATAWATDDLLKTTGFPPFGANGVAFNKSGNTLYVANTGNDSVVQIPVIGGVGGVAGKAAVLAYSINGADGLITDQDDNIWVCANQSDEVVVLDKTGKVIAKLGDFEGIDKKGAVRGLLFPASLVFSGDDVLVTNLVLDTRVKGLELPQTIDSQWAAQVTTYTVSKIHRHIPPVQDDDN